MATKTGQLGLRVAPEIKTLFQTAAASQGVSVARFIEQTAIEAAQRELADRTSFTLSADQIDAWETLNSEPAKDLPGLRELLNRPSPFVD